MSAVQEHQTITTLMSHHANAVPLIPEGLAIGDTVQVNWPGSMFGTKVTGEVTSINWGTGWVQLWVECDVLTLSAPGDRLTIIEPKRTRRPPKSLEDYDLRGFKQC